MTPKEALDWVENVFEEYQVQLPDVELTLIRQSLNQLERLKKFKETFDNYELAKKQDFIAYENWLECEAELTKTPTAEELCKVLSEYLQTVYGKVVIYYEDKNFGMEIQHSVDDVTSHELVSLLSDNIIYIGENLPPHINTMIGKFYEEVKRGHKG